ncbi:MAG: hypothetical protein ACI90M_001460, partial [Candidatus Azotimanducaceae bacterium]
PEVVPGACARQAVSMISVSMLAMPMLGGSYCRDA